MPQPPGDTPPGTPQEPPRNEPPTDELPAADSAASASVGALGRDGRHMPPWLPKAFLLAGCVVLLFMVGVWLLERLRGLLLLLVTSLFLAFSIEPAVNRLAARGWRRGLATGAMFILIAVVGGAFAAVLGSLLVSQTTHLIDGFPGYVDDVIDWVNDAFGTHLSQHTLFTKLPNVTDQLSQHLSSLAGNVWGIGATALGLLFQALGIVLFTFYLSAQGPQFRRAVCTLLPPRRQREVLRAWDIAIDKTGGYIYSRALLALVSAVAHYVALYLLDVPYAVTLALWVGVVSQFIPTVGTYLAGAVPVLIALAKSPSTALWVLAVIAAYQQFENYVLQPRITARTLDMHPAVAFGIVLAGTAIIGPLGALLALPVGASLQAFLSAYIRRYDVEEHPLTALAAPASAAPGRLRVRFRRRRDR
ncbi:AI-2E family transporter [Actinomadura yumaensis]|uniref:AI-2E family transporter n=1 Tax=Actinomadura yumaensis TaxID=111807 RepID=A0ABW2CKI7_9ACTN